MTPHLASLHEPFHLYEFTLEALTHMTGRLNLQIVAARQRYERTYAGLWHPVLYWLSKWLKRSYELEVLLRRV